MGQISIVSVGRYNGVQVPGAPSAEKWTKTMQDAGRMRRELAALDAWVSVDCRKLISVTAGFDVEEVD